MIRMKCGACRVGVELKRASDGPFSLSAKEEAHLVSAGVAEYVQNIPATGGQKAPVSAPVPEAGTTQPNGGDAPDGGDSGQDVAVQSIPESIAIPDTLGIVDGHFVRDDLMAMERKDMEALAADLGVDVSKCRNKGAIADLLAAIELDIAETAGEDDEAPPDIGAEGPVV